MFSYTPVSEHIKELMKNRDYLDYVKVLYNGPSPILKGHKPEPCMVTGAFKEHADLVKNLKIRKNDLWVLGYPKTGNNFLCELIETIMNNLDFAKIEDGKHREKVKFFETFFINRFPFYTIADSIAVESTKTRALKTHLPLNLLPDGLLRSSDHKMIYITRNPKEAVVSWFHYFQKAHGFQISLEDLVDCYLKGEVVWGSYFQHVSEYVRLSKVMKNLLIITYEEMVNDPISAIKRVAEFMGKPMSDSEAIKVAKFIHFDTMKDRKSSYLLNFFVKLNSDVENWEEKKFEFIRKGKTDSYKEELTEKQIEMFDLKKIINYLDWVGKLKVLALCVDACAW